MRRLLVILLVTVGAVGPACRAPRSRLPGEGSPTLQIQDSAPRGWVLRPDVGARWLPGPHAIGFFGGGLSGGAWLSPDLALMPYLRFFHGLGTGAALVGFDAGIRVSIFQGRAGQIYLAGETGVGAILFGIGGFGLFETGVGLGIDFFPDRRVGLSVEVMGRYEHIWAMQWAEVTVGVPIRF